MIKSINTPLTEDITTELKAGDSILLNGTIYTARDAAHGRLINLLNDGKDLPINMKVCVVSTTIFHIIRK